MTDILAVDLATVTGIARGAVGAAPQCATVRFAGDGGDAVFAAALQWAMVVFDTAPAPELVVLESLLPPDAMRNKTSRAVRDRLAGLHGVIRAVASLHDIPVAEATVMQVRAHFISARGLKRNAAKSAVIEQCKALGWHVANDNEADAAALWSFACAKADPRNALSVVPLFNPKLKVTVWP